MNERILVVDDTPAILDGVTDALAAEWCDVHGESDGSAALESDESGPFPSEHTLLALLAQEPGRVFTRREIMQHLWQSTYVGDERACDAHVSNLRRKIERDPSRPERIVTVPGFGYKLVAT
jgi:DNA-binding response OmpR family regulator